MQHVWYTQFIDVENIAVFYNFSLILLYIYIYIISVAMVFTFDYINLSTLTKILSKYPMHNRVTWVLFLLVLAGTPPFLVFFSKVFFFSMLLSVKAWGVLTVLLITNIVLFYIYLQNLIFLKKNPTTGFAKVGSSLGLHLDLYYIQVLFIYINTVAIFLFPLFLGTLYMFL